MQDQPLATYGHGEAIAHFGPLLSAWSDDIVVIHSGPPLSGPTLATLAARGIEVVGGDIARLEGTERTLQTIHLTDGRVLQRAGLFLAAPQRQVPLVRSLSLDTVPHPLNPDGLVKVNEHQQTSAPMLWAAGDVSSFQPQVVEAIATGGRAGAMMHAVLTLGALPSHGAPHPDPA